MSVPFFVTEKSKKEVIALYQSGHSIENIAKKYGCSSYPVQTVLIKNKVKKRRFGAGKKVKNDSMIISLYQNGKSMNDVSLDLGCSLATVCNVLKRNGVKARKHRVYSKDEEQSIVRFYNQGHSTTELADFYGTSMSMILKILERNNVDRRDASRVCKRKKYLFTCSSNRCFEMKSSYEVAYALFLDENNVEWEYEPCSFDLGFVGGRKRRWSYTPDFYLSESKEYIDVKGYQYENQRQRIELFKGKYPGLRFKIVSEADLQNLGIDLNRRRFRKWLVPKQRIDRGPMVEQSIIANPVNSVDTLTSKVEGNTEPSLGDKEGVTTIQRWSRSQERSKRGTPQEGDDIV